MATETRTPVLHAYDRVIALIEEKYKREHDGSAYGARIAFANMLGVSRQTLDNWGNRSGFPVQYIDLIAKITGLRADEIRPKSVIVELPIDLWDKICLKFKDARSFATIHTKRSRSMHGTR